MRRILQETVSSRQSNTRIRLPAVELLDLVFALSVDETDQVLKYFLPNSELKLVHQIRCEDLIRVEPVLGEAD